MEMENIKIKKGKIVVDKVKAFLKSNLFKKVTFIALFFFICSISMELLSGNNVLFVKILGFEASLDERIQNIKNTLANIFKFPKFISNFAILIFLYLFTYGITNKTKLSCTMIAVITTIFGTINYVVIKARGIAISISDIYSIKTAMSVAKGIKIDLEGNFFVAMFLIVFALFILWKFGNFNDSKKNVKRRVMITASGILAILLVSICKPLMDDVQLWNINNAYAYSGTGLTLVRMVKDLRINKPSNYNSNDIKNLLSNYEDNTENYEGDLPNVVVIMNESFADLQSVFDFEMSEDNIPYFHELINGEDIVSGIMHSSLYGGGTANVEYEFLTQNTVAFLPSGAMPYQQYIRGQVNESIVATMNKLGYNSYGIHSWQRDGYSRGKVYNCLQFNNSLFKENMSELRNSINEYPSDESTYEYYYEIMKNKLEGERNFSFIVTMQNHLPYVHYRDEIPFYVSDNPDLKCYLQYETLSDNALEGFINFLRDYDENTVLLFFGDHQPNLKLDSMYEIKEDYSSDEAQYIIPFFIWANYDIEEKYNVETSTNYLQSLLFEVAGLPKNSYINYMTELREYLPVITANYYIDKDGNYYEINSTDSPYYVKLDEYWKITYYQIFDNK